MHLGRLFGAACLAVAVPVESAVATTGGSAGSSSSPVHAAKASAAAASTAVTRNQRGWPVGLLSMRTPLRRSR